MSEAALPPPWWKDRILVGLLGLGIVARIAAIAGSPLLNADGYFYLESAAQMRAGEWTLALQTWSLHPFYPLLVAGAQSAIASPWAAGAIVSLLGSLGAMGSLYALVQDGWGRNAARATLFLYALHPRLAPMESEVMTEGAYHALAFGAVLLLERGFRHYSWKHFLGAGALTGAAYATRSEGLILAGTGLFVAAGIAAQRPFRRSWKFLGLAAAAAVLVASPFLLSLRGMYGRWIASHRPAAYAATNPSRQPVREWEAAAWRRLGRGPGSVVVVANQAQKAYHAIPLVLAVLTLVWLRRGSGGGWTGAMAGALGGLGLAAVTAYHFQSGHPVSVRYVSTAVGLLLPWAGWALYQLLSRLSLLRHGRLWAAALLAAIGAIQAVQVPDFGDARQRAFRDAADWLRENGGRGRIVVSDHGGVAYHAAMGLIKDHRVWEKLPAIAREGKVDFLVLSDRERSKIPPERWKAIEELPGFAEIKRSGEGPHQVAVYTIRPSP